MGVGFGLLSSYSDIGKNDRKGRKGERKKGEGTEQSRLNRSTLITHFVPATAIKGRRGVWRGGPGKEEKKEEEIEGGRGAPAHRSNLSQQTTTYYYIRRELTMTKKKFSEKGNRKREGGGKKSYRDLHFISLRLKENWREKRVERRKGEWEEGQTMVQ